MLHLKLGDWSTGQIDLQFIHIHFWPIIKASIEIKKWKYRE